MKSFRDSERQSVIGKEEAKNQLANLSQQHQDEMQQLHDTYTAQVQEREKVISNLTEGLSKAELELTLQTEDFKKELENLRETLQQTEDERDKYAALCEKQQSDHSKALESSSNRLHDRVRDLEDQLEDKERQL